MLTEVPATLSQDADGRVLSPALRAGRLGYEAWVCIAAAGVQVVDTQLGTGALVSEQTAPLFGFRTGPAAQRGCCTPPAHLLCIFASRAAPHH